MSIVDQIVAAYANNKSIRGAAKECGLSGSKCRKLLITAGVIQPEITRQIIFYRKNGLTDKQISEKLGIKVRTLNGYMPYKRLIYNQLTRSTNAERISAWRKRKKEERNA